MMTWNLEKYAAEAVEGVLRQKTDFPLELVIGDDGSTDRTVEVCSAYARAHPGKIRLLVRDKKLGQLRNFADTLAHCRGEYIALLDGDDHWTSSDKLQRQVKLLEDQRSCAACFSRALVVDEKGNRLGVMPEPRDRKAYLCLADVLRKNTIPTSTVVFRNGAVARFPDWYFSLGYHDWAFFVMLANVGPWAFLDEDMSVYRIRSDSLFQGRGMLQRFQWQVDFYGTISDYVGPAYGHLIREMTAVSYHHMAIECFEKGDLRRAQKYSWECARHLPLRSLLNRRGILLGALHRVLVSLIRRPACVRSIGVDE